jgi:hypothetical protein
MEESDDEEDLLTQYLEIISELSEAEAREMCYDDAVALPSASACEAAAADDEPDGLLKLLRGRLAEHFTLKAGEAGDEATAYIAAAAVEPHASAEEGVPPHQAKGRRRRHQRRRRPHQRSSRRRAASGSFLIRRFRRSRRPSSSSNKHGPTR